MIDLPGNRTAEKVGDEDNERIEVIAGQKEYFTKEQLLAQKEKWEAHLAETNAMLGLFE